MQGFMILATIGTEKDTLVYDVYKTLCPQQMLVHKGGQFN